MTDEHKHEPHIQVVKGRPTELENGRGHRRARRRFGRPVPSHGSRKKTCGAIPVDRLRYSFFSWQKVTLQGRTHLRHR